MISIPVQYTPKLFTLLRSGYTRNTLRLDAVAGLTVAIVALPLAMALAIASGASPEKGLVTAVVAGFLISLFGGSRVQVGGPTGAFVVVIYSVIAQHGYDGLILATLLAGIILIVAGYAGLGQVIKFIPQPVVVGFTTGIAVIIATTQVKDFLGLRLTNVPANFLPKWQAYAGHLSAIDPTTVVIGVVALSIILGLRRFAPKWPGFLIAVVGASLVVAAFHMPVDTIGSRFPAIGSSLDAPRLPSWDFAKLRAIVPSAFTIAFLAGIEALLSAVVADGMTGYKHRSNQELVGQGIANLAAAFLGGLPATGAIARTATNIRAGARTPMAGMFHAAFLLGFMLLAMDLMKYVPMAALAAILFVVAWGMSDVTRFVRICRISPSDRAILLLTFLLTVMVDLTVAIGVGVTIASLLFMREMTHSVEITADGCLTRDLSDYTDAEEPQRSQLPRGVEVFRITGPVFFGVAGDLVDTLKSIGQVPRVLIVRMRLVPFLDATGAAALAGMVQACRDRGTKVVLSGAGAQPRAILEKVLIRDDGNGVVFSPDYPTSLHVAEALLAAPHGQPGERLPD